MSPANLQNGTAASKLHSTVISFAHSKCLWGGPADRHAKTILAANCDICRDYYLDCASPTSVS
jgi:hypothetical protein